MLRKAQSRGALVLDAMMKSRTRFRFNLELSSKANDNLEAILKSTNAASRTEVIRDALALYKQFVEFTDSGGQVVFRKDGKDEIIRFIRL